MLHGTFDSGANVITVAVSAAAKQVIGRNPDRVALLLPTSSTVSYAIGPNDKQLSLSGPIVVVESQLSFVLHRRDVGSLICEPWYIIASGNGSVNILEVIGDPLFMDLLRAGEIGF